jgi:gliding motility-associated-like protein
MKYLYLLLQIILFAFISSKLTALPITEKTSPALKKTFNSTSQAVDINCDGLIDIFHTGTDGINYYTVAYLNNGGFNFSAISLAGIPNLQEAKTDWADYNNDGFPDLILSGLNGSSKKTSLYKNNGDSTFTEITSAIENVAYGAVLWSDFNNDGKTDIIINGVNASGVRITKIYKNTGTGFIMQNSALMGISNGKTVVADFNNDGKTDIFYNGINAVGQKGNYLYLNKGNFVFELAGTSFETTTNGDIEAADIDGNGYTDLLITGTNISGKRISKLYLNNHFVFVESATAMLDSLSSSSLSTTDINNDGKLDIFLTGQDKNDFYQTLLFINNGDGTFTKDATFPIALIYADFTLADFNSDSKPDIFVSGKTYSGDIAKIYQNNYPVSNTAPTVPASLISNAKYDSVSLSWGQPTDAESSSAQLTYNIYIGKTPGNIDVYSPLSFVNNGLRKISTQGNTFSSRELKLKNLEEGIYYWSVQSIDNNNNASAFAAEQSFTICYKPNLGKDTSICYADTLKLSIGSGNDVVNWYALPHTLLETNSKILKYPLKNSADIFCEITKSYGCTVYDTIKASPRSLPKPILGNDTSICFKSKILLSSGSTWDSTAWHSKLKGYIISDAANYEHTSVLNDTIWEIVRDNHGCIGSDTIIVLKNNLPVVNLGTDLRICFKDTAKLPALNNFNTAEWRKINSNTILSNSKKYFYEVLKTDTLVVRVSDNNTCANTDTIIVNKLEWPKIKLGKDTAVCFKQQITINAQASTGTLVWYSLLNGQIASNQNNVSIKVLSNDSIWAVNTDVNGCHSADSIFIKKLSLPEFNIGNDTSVCFGSDVYREAGTGWKEVDWFSRENGLIANNSWFLNRNITKTDSIWAVVTTSDNCVNIDSALFTCYALPVFNIGRDTAVCLHDSILLSSGNTWKKQIWKTSLKGEISRKNSIYWKVEEKDSLNLTFTDNKNCVNRDTIIISPLALPKFNLPTDTSLCFNDTLKLTVGNKWKQVNWKTITNANNSLVDYTYCAKIEKKDKIIVTVINPFGCSSEDSTNVSVFQLPIINLGNDTSICINNTVNLKVADTLKKAEWRFNNDLIENQSRSIKIKPVNSETVTVKAYTYSGCFSFDTINITVNMLPEVFAGNDTVVCYNSLIVLGGNPTASKGGATYKYFWGKLTDDQNNAANPVIKAISDSIIPLKVVDSNGCISSDTIQFKVNPPSKFSLPDTLGVCIGKAITIDRSKIISGSRFSYNFEWSPDSTIDNFQSELPVFKPNLNTRYRVIAKTFNCKPDTAFIDVVVRHLPVIYITPTLTIGEKGFAQLYAEGGSHYLWSPANSLNQANIQNPTAKPDFSTTYMVQVTDTFGCTNQDSVRVNVANSIFIPSLFTPNGDGTNDKFKIYGFGILEMTLRIADKQNKIVFESSEWNKISGEGWDGEFEGVPLKEGTYRWIISGKFINGETIQFKGKQSGTFTLIR